MPPPEALDRHCHICNDDATTIHRLSSSNVASCIFLWAYFVCNTDVRAASGQPVIGATVRQPSLWLFGHIVRFPDSVLANVALRPACEAVTFSGLRRFPGRPSTTRLYHHITQDTRTGIHECKGSIRLEAYATASCEALRWWWWWWRHAELTSENFKMIRGRYLCKSWAFCFVLIHYLFIAHFTRYFYFLCYLCVLCTRRNK